MAVEGNYLASYIDYIGLELILPQDGSLAELGMAMFPVGKVAKLGKLLKGKGAVKAAAKLLGIDPKKASAALHKIKYSSAGAGRGGAAARTMYGSIQLTAT